MRIRYNPHLKQLARHLRNNSTRAEIRLWQSLKHKQLRGYDFHRQKPIDCFEVDFFCNRLKLVIEVDGVTHGSMTVQEKDQVRELRLRSLGLTVMRFQDKDVMEHLNGVFDQLLEYIERFEKLHTP